MRTTADHAEGNHDADAAAFSKAGKGSLQMKSAGAAGAAAAAKASPLERLVGVTVKDDGGFVFVLDADLAFRVIASPPGSEKAIGKRLTADDASPKIAAAWKMLAGKLEHEHPAPAEVVTAAPPPPAEPSLISSALDLARSTLSGAGDYLSGLVGGVTDGIGGFFSGGDEAAPAQDVAPKPPAPPKDAAPAEDPKKPAIPAPSVDGKQDTLAVAKDLSELFNVPHGWEKSQYAEATAGDPAGQARVSLLTAGDTTGLKSVVCSEFTALTLAKAGWDLNALYRDPATGLKVAYFNPSAKPSKKKPIPAPKFVNFYAVVQIFVEATSAILQAQSGGCERIVAGSDRAREVGAENETEDFLYSASGSLADGIAIDDDTEFGAGAVAVGLGGKSVPRDERKPGDLQQAFNTVDGIAKGSGHSSQVWSVRGPGIAQLGAPGAPLLHGTPSTPVDQLEPGWYEVGGDGLAWEVGPDTDPATVATLSAAEVQTIDANISRGTDSTGVGGFSKQKAFSKEGKSTAYSDGRLPTSRWFDWAARLDVPVLAHLTAAVTSKKKK